MVTLAALLTYNLADAFPQHSDAQYDSIVTADYGHNLKAHNSGFKCPRTFPVNSTCNCNLTSKDFEINCPALNPKLTAKILPGEYAQVQCYEEHDFSELPNMHVGDTNQIKTILCTLPANQPIMQTISFFGATNVKDFWIHNYGRTIGAPLVRKHFEGMRDLEKLTINCGNEEIPTDLFAELPNLTEINLQKNGIKKLHNVFDNLIKLDFLDLRSNELTELEPGLLKDLQKLTELELSQNNLRSITKESFRGVENLQYLTLTLNDLESLSADVFDLLPNLKKLSLGYNRLSTLPATLLSKNLKLEEFSLIHNLDLRTLPSNLLSNLPLLESVSLSDCGFTELPASLFSGSNNILEIDLSHNELSSIPDTIFQDQTNLQYLKLEFNELEFLPDRLLETNKELIKTLMGYNRFVNLTANTFKSLTKLTDLDLSNNHLHTIHKRAFERATKLERLYLQNNRLTFHHSLDAYEKYSSESDGTSFQYLNRLEELNLSNNTITSILRDWILSAKLSVLDLSYNNLTHLTYRDFDFVQLKINVDVSHNRIVSVDLTDLESVIKQNKQSDAEIHMNINDNPLNCDCNTLDFSRYLDKQLDEAVYRRVKFDVEDLMCAEPPNLYNKPVSMVKPKEMLCELDTPSDRRCPPGCSCFVRPADLGIIVDCSGLGLTQIPALPEPYRNGYQFIELHVENNSLTELPTKNLTGYNAVADLLARANFISTIRVEQLPSNLRVLDLTHNKLTMLNETVVEALNSSTQLVNISLSENPWNCECEASRMMRFVLNNHKRVLDISKVACENGRTFESINVSDLCNENLTAIIALCVILSIVGVLIGIFTVLYFNYHMEIKVWMFTHNVFVWLVTEEELDRDKLYDAFISYSHQDEDFITEHLIPTLEKEPMSFKTCWHVRDFMPGEQIMTQIVKAVEDSRRTIVVLSSNFLQSEWGKMEFRTAHLNSMSEKRIRVIIVIYGDIGELDEQMDSELKAYLKMNTYVKWGDPWFWDKLRYSMPHPPAVKGWRGARKNQVNQATGSAVDDALVELNERALIPSDAKLNGELNPKFTRADSLKGTAKANGFVKKEAVQIA